MTSPEPPTTPETPPEAPRRLTRSSTDKLAGGVAGGLGGYFSVDPILFRIGFAVLAFAGGAGLLAYLALWLLVPDEQGETVLRSGNRAGAILGVGLIGLLILIFAPDFHFFPFGGGLFVLLALITLGVLVAQGAKGKGTGGALMRALAIAGTIVLAWVLGLGAAAGAAFGGGAIVAAVVIVAGLALVAGAFTGGRRWLLVPALALAAPLAVVTAADLRFEGGFGEREYRPAAVSDLRPVYRLGAGDLQLDLRDVDFPQGRTTVNLEVGAGDVRVLVPEDVCVRSEVRIGAGAVEVFGRDNAGFDVDWSESPANPARAPALVIMADLDMGGLEIDDNTTGDDWRGHDRGPFGNHRGDDRPDAERNTACRVAA